jgi:uncharacterized membrane protein
MRESKRRSTPLSGPDGRPLHPIAASVATGAWVCSLGFDLVSQVATDAGVYTRGAYWLILTGIGFGLVAATLGLFDVLALPRNTKVFRTGVQHLVVSDVALLVFMLSFVLRRFLTFIETPWSLVALSVIGLVALGAASWSGLSLTYRWGVRVRDEAEQLPGYEQDAATDDRSQPVEDRPAPAAVLDDAPADGEDVGVATHET